MSPKSFNRQIRRLNCSLPLIGGWMRLRAAKRLVQESSPAATKALALTAIRSEDARVRETCWAAIQNAAGVGDGDAVYGAWAETRDTKLAELISRRHLVASGPPGLRVLTALHCEAYDVLRGGGPDSVGPVIEAAGDPDTGIATRAKDILPQLTNSKAVDELCRLWSESRSPVLSDAILKAGYVARKPTDLRILTALFTGQSRALAEDGPEIVGPLVKACEDANTDVAGRARNALIMLKNPDAREAVCRLVVEGGTSAVQEAAIAGRYAPREAVQRALFFALTNQWERYEELDFDQSLLRAAFATTNANIRQRLLAAMRAAGRTDLLFSAITNGVGRGSAGALPETELRAVVAMLEEQRDWMRMWGLIFEAPLFWSVRLVRLLDKAGWRPSEADANEAFSQLRQMAHQELAGTVDELAALVPPAVCMARARVKGNVNAVAIAGSRPVIAIGTGRGSLALWNFQHGRLEWTRSGFDHSIGRVAFTVDGKLVCGERTVGHSSCRLYICKDGGALPIGEHGASVTGLEALQGSLLMSTGRDCRVCLWDVDRGRQVARRDLTFWARGLKLSPTGKNAVLSHAGVTVLTVPELNSVHNGDDAFGGVARSACFSPDAKTVIAGKVNGQLVALTLAGDTRRRARKLTVEHRGEITGLASLASRQALVSAEASGRIQFTSWPQETRLGFVEAGGVRLTSLHVSEDNAFMVTGDSGAEIAFWDIRGLELPLLLSRPLLHATPTHLAVAAAFQRAKGLASEAKRALAFLEILLRFRFRYDVELDEVSTIRAGEFDIEVLE